MASCAAAAVLEALVERVRGSEQYVEHVNLLRTRKAEARVVRISPHLFWDTHLSVDTFSRRDV